MSRGLGWVQRACMLAIETFDEDGMPGPTTYQIAAAIYDVQPDKAGNRYVSDAQHVATKRALEGLQRKGYVIGFRAHWNRGRAMGGGISTDGRTELCHTWMVKRQLDAWLDMHKENSGDLGKGLVKRVKAKAKAIGML